MKRTLNKNENPIELLQEAEKDLKSDIIDSKKTRDEILEQEMDTAFYFSVIFETREERDKFLNKYKITLQDNYSVLAKDFINKF